MTNYRFDPTFTNVVFRNIRIGKGLTQKEVAKRMRYKASATISHYENDMRSIPLDKMVDYADALGFDVEIKLIERRTR